MKTLGGGWKNWAWVHPPHYSDIIVNLMEFQITIVLFVYSTISSGADQRKHDSSTSLALARGIHWWSVNSPHKGPVMQKMFPFDDVIMYVQGFVYLEFPTLTWKSNGMINFLWIENFYWCFDFVPSTKSMTDNTVCLMTLNQTTKQLHFSENTSISVDCLFIKIMYQQHTIYQQLFLNSLRPSDAYMHQ